MPRNIRKSQTLLHEWSTCFHSMILASDGVCPDFCEMVQMCAKELLTYAPLTSVFGYLENIFRIHNISDTKGASYWFLKQHYLRQYPFIQLPHTLNDHWVTQHFTLLCTETEHDHDITRKRLLLEREHARDIA